MEHEITFLKYHKDWVNFVSLAMLDFGHKSGFICWFLGQWVKSGHDGFNYYYHYFSVKGCYYSKVTGAERINSLLLICVSYIWTQSFHSFSPVWTQIAFSRRAQICYLTWQLLFFLPFSKLCLLCSCFFFFFSLPLLLCCVTPEMCLFYRQEGRSLPGIHNPLLSVLIFHFKLL